MDVADRRTDRMSHCVGGSRQRKGRSIEFGVASNEHVNSHACLDRENDVLNV
jgi:hypothetical protein